MLDDSIIDRAVVVQFRSHDDKDEEVGDDGHDPTTVGFDREVPFYFGEHVQLFKVAFHGFVGG